MLQFGFLQVIDYVLIGKLPSLSSSLISRKIVDQVWCPARHCRGIRGGLEGSKPVGNKVLSLRKKKKKADLESKEGILLYDVGGF